MGTDETICAYVHILRKGNKIEADCDSGDRIPRVKTQHQKVYLGLVGDWVSDMLLFYNVAYYIKCRLKCRGLDGGVLF